MYLGKPGQLQLLPNPTGSVGAAPDLGEAVHELLDGGSSVDYAAGDVKTRWSFTWEGLDAASASTLRSFATRQRGRGPWVLYMPETRHNVLSPNVASGARQLGAITGMSVAGAGESLSYNATANGRIFSIMGSQQWDLPSAPAVGVLLVDSPYPDYFGFPTAQGHTWVFGAYIRSSTSVADSVFDARVGLNWYDVSGAFLSASTPAYSAISTAYVLRTFSASAPANAAFVRPFVQVDPTTITAAARMRIDGMHLEIASSLADVLVGDGLSRVSIVSPARDLPVAEWSTIKLQFQEV